MIHENDYTKLRSMVTVLLFVLLLPLSAGRELEHFHAVTVKDGLADNFVRDIFTDSEGYVWLSTINGLSRYDGYHFLTFHPHEWGGRSGDVTMVRETADGTLWMCCAGELLTYCKDAQTWQKDGGVRLREMGVGGSSMSCFYVDDGGGLWIATEQGLYAYDYAEGRVRHYRLDELGGVLHIVSKNGTTLVVSTGYHVFKATASGKLIRLTRHPKPAADNRDSRAMMDSKMNLWLYCSHVPAGSLWVYSLGSGAWMQPETFRRLGDGVTVNALAEDRDGQLWVGTGNQGTIVNELGVSLRSLPHISCLFADRNNTMWVGSAKLGAAYADLNRPDFNHVSTEGREDVSALLEDAQGNLWIGFDGDGVVVNGRSFSLSDGTLPSDNVTALADDGSGGILVGTYGGGIARFDGKGFAPVYTDNDRLHYVKALVADRHKRLWVATVDRGVVCIADGKYTYYTEDNSPLPSNGVVCLAYDAPSDRIYIGTSTGLAAYNCSRGSFIHDDALDSLRNVYVTTLLVDDGGRLWIGSRDGLWVKGRGLTRLTTEQGLTNNVVRALAVSGNTVWASTDNGLTKIEEQCHPYFDSDGLHGILFSNNAALTTREGHVLLGSMTGYVSIAAGSEQEKVNGEKPLRVRFTEFRINGQPVVKSPQDFTIGYGERLGVSISVMVPALSHRARYLYRFKNEDEWMRAPDNMLYFASLMPGTHVLQVKAELPGMTVTEVSELTFKVLPPLWLSKGAIACFLLLIAAAVWLAWRAVRRRQKRELAMKQMELNLKKYEMEEQKIGFFTNISHDIKTPLTMVMAPLEKIRDASLPAAVRTEIDVAWQNARQLYDLVLELLDFRRLDEGKEKLKLSHGELVSFVRQTVQGYDYIARRKNITMELHLPANPVEMLFDENKMRRVIINLLSNACKYNVEGGSVTVMLTSGPSSSAIQLSVADTGIGIKDKHRVFDRFMQETHGQEQEGSGLGLHIVRQYVDMMGGSISIEDNKPRGTVFTVTLPKEVPISSPEANMMASSTDSKTLEASSGAVGGASASTILVVEDNTDARQFLQRSLEDEYRVLLAANGKEALGQLEKAESQRTGERAPGIGVSLIVSDVMMPVMDGMELVRQIRKDVRFSHIPVILLTAKSNEDDIIAGLEEGVADYLTKPYSLAVLRLRIKKILEWTQHVHEQVASGIEINPSEMTVSSLDEELISHVIAEVEANISNPNYSVVQLSAAVGMTRGHLYKKLMAIVGKSPVEFIRILRIKRGKSLLDQGRTNISEVADKVGCSPKMFAQYFKEMFGTTPSEYLRQLK